MPKYGFTRRSRLCPSSKKHFMPHTIIYNGIRAFAQSMRFNAHLIICLGIFFIPSLLLSQKSEFNIQHNRIQLHKNDHEGVGLLVKYNKIKLEVTLFTDRPDSIFLFMQYFYNSFFHSRYLFRVDTITHKLRISFAPFVPEPRRPFLSSRLLNNPYTQLQERSRISFQIDIDQLYFSHNSSNCIYFPADTAATKRMKEKISREGWDGNRKTSSLSKYMDYQIEFEFAYYKEIDFLLKGYSHCLANDCLDQMERQKKEYTAFIFPTMLTLRDLTLMEQLIPLIEEEVAHTKKKRNQWKTIARMIRKETKKQHRKARL